jgi:hypothetical protein
LTVVVVVFVVVGEMLALVDVRLARGVVVPLLPALFAVVFVVAAVPQPANRDAAVIAAPARSRVSLRVRGIRMG